MEDNYKQLVELISSNLDTPVEEIERKIEAKQAKLSGLISKEGAAQVVAAELGVNFDKQLIKISQMVTGMKKINVTGKIINLYPVREYSKNGRSGRIGSFVLADDTSNVRVVLWDENHIDLIVKGEIFENGIVEINNASLRNGELHLTGFSEIKNSTQSFEEVVTEKPTVTKKIIDFNQHDNASTRAVIVQLFEPKFFEVCPECRRKATEEGCETHGKIVPEKRALLNFVIDDGTDSIRAVMFSGEIDKLIPEKDLDNPEIFSSKKEELLGKELIVSGQVRRSNLYNNNELIISDISEVNVDKLIEELER
jgi:ssDNA-binding replication factor A large subunit